eukprot:1315581-Rhodomonas_salina.2
MRGTEIGYGARRCAVLTRAYCIPTGSYADTDPWYYPPMDVRISYALSGTDMGRVILPGLHSAKHHKLYCIHRLPTVFRTPPVTLSHFHYRVCTIPRTLSRMHYRVYTISYALSRIHDPVFTIPHALSRIHCPVDAIPYMHYHIYAI